MPSVERAIPAVRVPLLSGGDAAAFFPFATTGEDNLRVTTFNSVGGVNVEIAGRVRGADGTPKTFSFIHALTDDRLAQSVNYALSAGVLLNLTVHTTGQEILFGHAFVIVQLIRGFTGDTTVLGTLLQGYITGTQHLSWPGSPIKHTREHDGVVRFLYPADPGAGLAVTQLVPPGAIWQPISLRFRFTASAAAANRQPFVSFFDGLGGTELYHVASPFIVIANGDIFSTFGAGAFVDNATMLGSMRAQGLPAVELGQLYTIVLNAAAFQAGDQLRSVVIGVREWLEGRS